jgi:predicted enzyme related to lactoylglutathione lyase
MSSLVVHFEIHASEPQRLIDFYGELLGWRFEQFGDVPYWTIDTGEGSIGMDSPGMGINGGLAQREGPAPDAGAPVNGCTVVIGVDDVDASMARALELGGAESVPAEDLQGVGRVGYLRDPDGNVFGLIAEVPSDDRDVRQGPLDPMQVTPEP